MKWYCTIKESMASEVDHLSTQGFKSGVLYEYKTNNESNTQAFNGRNWFWINTDYFDFLHTI